MDKRTDTIAKRMFLGMIATLAANTAAHADSTTLICNTKFPNILYEDEATTVELNDANSSAVVHLSGIHLKDPSSVSGGEDGHGGYNAKSIGPAPAQFSTNTITFSYQNQYGYTYSFAINRLTGDFSDLNNDTVWSKYTCHAGKPQF